MEKYILNSKDVLTVSKVDEVKMFGDWVEQVKITNRWHLSYLQLQYSDLKKK